MTAPIRHRSAGMLIVPDLLVREVLMESMQDLLGDRFRLDELFERADDGLRTGTARTWVADMKETFGAMMAEESAGIAVGVGYPIENTRMPYVSVVCAGGSEDDASATMANIIGRHGEALGDLTGTAETATGRARSHVQIGIDWRTNVQVGTWATTPEHSSVLHAVVKHLLFRDKTKLFVAGVQDIALSDTGFEPDQRMHPRIGYVPVVNLRVSHTMAQTRRRDPVPTKITAAVGRFSN